MPKNSQEVELKNQPSVDHNKWLGDIIRKDRKRMGLTQEGLADAMMLSRASIANMEVGRQEVSWTHLLIFRAIFHWKEIPLPDIKTKMIEIEVPDFNSKGQN